MRQVNVEGIQHGPDLRGPQTGGFYLSLEMVICSRYQMGIAAGCDPPLPVSTFICWSTSSTWGNTSWSPAGVETLVRRRFLGGSGPTVLISTGVRHCGKPTLLCHVLDSQPCVELNPQVLSPKFNYLWCRY